MNLLPKPVASAIIIVVTVVWAANFALQFVVDGYQSDVAINAIFMGIVGGAFALSRRAENQQQQQPPPPPPTLQPPTMPPADPPAGGAS